VVKVKPDLETRFREVWYAIKEKRDEMKAEDKKEKEEKSGQETGYHR